ncbi:haloacid dehalogenase [Shewanella sp. c952]|uniref:HAD-IA family hydrolase n=1 Tax=Shewanella sp. c952 TaxID=2815913 RepID=UPI001BBF6BB6|nr:HAD-IA family hydrolase [Shewanella sp. c952]GIU07963.1 haloacid dehalogenase [Shewanella sp. c952]
MKLFIRPEAFSVISFDLDDTLYDNRPIIRQAEAASQQFLNQQYPKSQAWQVGDWHRLKLTLIKQRPQLRHDPSLARQAMLECGLVQLGYDARTAKAGATAVFDHFVIHRSHFSVSDPVLELLAKLKQNYRLIGITNGNVDYQRIGLGDLLEFVLHPGQGFKQKPAADMFVQAAKQLNIPLRQILHIGDSAMSDVVGARQAGCQAVWLNPGFGVTEEAALTLQLPHIEIGNIQELLKFKMFS